MDENQFNKIIGFGIVLILTANILQIIEPVLVYGVGILIAARILIAFSKHK